MFRITVLWINRTFSVNLSLNGKIALPVFRQNLVASPIVQNRLLTSEAAVPVLMPYFGWTVNCLSQSEVNIFPN